MSQTFRRLPLDAPWEEKEDAYEEVVRDLIAELRDEDPLGIAEEDIDDEVGRALRGFHGLPGYEYLQQVERRREAQEQRRRAAERQAAEARDAERMRGCSDDPPF